MLNVDILKPYLIKLDDFETRIIDSRIKNLGIEKTFSYYLETADCTKIANDDYRYMQTIAYPYYLVISDLVYIIEQYVENNKEEYYNKLITRHNMNLDYEKVNPPIQYDKITFKKSTSTKRRKTDDNKEPRVTAAERKLATKIGKINALKFNLKPVKNGDNNTI